MKLKTVLGRKTYEFRSLKEVVGKANELKSGDRLAGVAAETVLERIAAKTVLAGITVGDILEHPAVPYEEDSVTRIIMDDLDTEMSKQLRNLTIGELRERILDPATDSEKMLAIGRGLSSECIAALCKLMTNLDLIYAGSRIRVKATCNTTIGGEGVFASRLQPNHPTDNPKGVRASVLEGLSYGIGDAVLGLNPATDSMESTKEIWKLLEDMKETYGIPTQTCVLSHITTQMKALASGGKADLCFQSIAGSQKALESFGISTELLSEGLAMFREEGSAKGPNVMYFETGQASELSASAHYGWDQVTMECRCYGLARHYNPFLVNTVVGFMGPEYLYDSKQLLRAGLEDVFCGHLHGLPMGCDACYTNHMPTDQNDIENLLVLLCSAGCHFVIGVPQGDDVMLMYQSTGFHDIAAVRELLHKRPVPEFERWLEEYGLWQDGRLGKNAGNADIFDALQR